MKTTTHYKEHRWTTEELRTLMQMWANKEPLHAISAKLNSTNFAISKMVLKLRKNGIPLERRKRGHVLGRSNQSWTQGEVEYLLRRRSEKATVDEIAVELSRTRSACDGIIAKLRAEGVPIAMMGQGVRRLWNANALKVVAIQSPEANVIELDALRKANA